MKILAEIATVVGGQCFGDDTIAISGFASLDDIQTGKLVFITRENMLADVDSNEPTALMTRDEWRPSIDIPLIIVDDPYLAYAKASSLFSRKTLPNREVHPSAVIHETATVGEDVRLPLAL